MKLKGGFVDALPVRDHFRNNQVCSNDSDSNGRVHPSVVIRSVAKTICCNLSAAVSEHLNASRDCMPSHSENVCALAILKLCMVR